MTGYIDRFGREIDMTIVCDDEGNFLHVIAQVDGLRIESPTPENALNTLDAMAPDGWVEE